MSICLQGGSLQDDTHAHEQLLAGVDPYPGPNNGGDAMLLLSSAPVLKGARNGGSSQMQELLHNGR